MDTFHRYFGTLSSDGKERYRYRKFPKYFVKKHELNLIKSQEYVLDQR